MGWLLALMMLVNAQAQSPEPPRVEVPDHLRFPWGLTPGMAMSALRESAKATCYTDTLLPEAYSALCEIPAVGQFRASFGDFTVDHSLAIFVRLPDGTYALYEVILYSIEVDATCAAMVGLRRSAVRFLSERHASGATVERSADIDSCSDQMATFAAAADSRWTANVEGYRDKGGYTVALRISNRVWEKKVDTAFRAWREKWGKEIDKKFEPLDRLMMPRGRG